MSFIFRRLAWLLLLLAAPFMVAAAPVNDNFADRIEVTSGSFITGTNVGATAEAGEPLPGGYTASTYQGTVWYVFYPPSIYSEGYEINTLGSAIDTVLAVWKGTGLNDLQLVQVNDEAFEGSVSRIRIPAPDADGHVPYFISVAGRNASARGAIKLSVHVGSPRMVTSVSAASFTPSTVDVGTMSSTTFSVSMSVVAEVATGYVKLYSPDRVQVASASYSGTNRVSGSLINGTYNVTLTLPDSLTPGDYLVGFEAQDSLNNNLKADSFGWDQMTALDLLPTLTVQNSKIAAYNQFAIDNGLSGGNAAQTADPDRDGIKNLAEFAFGLNPNVPQATPLVVTNGTLVQRGLPYAFLTGTGSQQRMRVQFIRLLPASGKPAPTYQVQFSDDLVHWTTAVNAPVVAATSAGYEAVSVDDTVTGALRSRRFAHVVITY